MAKSTHFNPVDLVCAIRDYEGKPFNLPDYVDPQTGFISNKSKDGKELLLAPMTLDTFRAPSSNEVGLGGRLDCTNIITPILSVITNDVDIVAQSLNQSITQVIASIVQIVGILVMMLTISLPLTLVVLATVPLSLVIVMRIVKVSQRYFKLSADTLGDVNGIIEEDFSGQVVIQAFNRGERAVEYLSGKRYLILYRVLYVGAVFVGAIVQLHVVWNVADLLNGLMAIPNLVSLLALAGVIVAETRQSADF